MLAWFTVWWHPLGLPFLMGSLDEHFVLLAILLSHRASHMFHLFLLLLLQLSLLILSVILSQVIPQTFLHLTLIFFLQQVISLHSLLLFHHWLSLLPLFCCSYGSEVHLDWKAGLHDGWDYSVVSYFGVPYCRVCYITRSHRLCTTRDSIDGQAQGIWWQWWCFWWGGWWCWVVVRDLFFICDNNREELYSFLL